MTQCDTYLLGCLAERQPVFRNRIPNYTMQAGRRMSLLAISIMLVALIALTGIASADSYVGGIPLSTVQTGTVTGGLYIDATPAPNWGDKIVTKSFTLPENAVGNITWARLYISAYAGHMQNDNAFTITNKFDGNGDGTYEQAWPETGHGAFHYLVAQDDGIVGNDNSAFTGHGSSEPYLMINDHENRVTSDYFMWYDVTSMISSSAVNVNVDTTGSYDGRIKVITLVVAYNNASSTTETTYWVNQGHDVCSYYTEENEGKAATGATSFATTGLSGITSATLTADYMASNNGNYGFPTAANNFEYTGDTSLPVSGTFTNVALDRVADVQGSYSGLDSWDVTSSVTGASDVTFAYSRYFPGTGTAAFYKLPLAFLVVKSPRPAVTPVAGFTANITSSTAPMTVQFTDVSTNTPTSWAWTFGDSSTGTEQNPVHEYTAVGNYTVALTATNSAGSNTATQTGYITVSAAVVTPVANFTATPTSGSAPLTVTFTDASTNTPTSWAWDFGDNSTTNATVQNPVHTFAAAGTYTVTLTATNTAGNDGETKTGYVTVTAAGTGGLANTAWPKFQGNAKNTGLSFYTGPQTANVLWTYPAGGSMRGSPVIGSDGTLYIGNSGDNNIYALNPDGALKWSYTTGGKIYGSPAIGSDGTIYFGNYGDKKVYAINTDGTLKWSYTTGGAIYSSPAIGSDGTIYIGSNDKNLYAINTDGTLKWSYTTGGTIYSSPAIGSDGTIYFGNYGDYKIYALNPEGTLKWSYTTGGKIYGSPAIASDGTIYIGNNAEGKVYAINTDGTLRWSYTAGSGIEGSPAIGSDGTVYIGDYQDHSVYALNPDGTLKWSYTTGAVIRGSPAIGSDGTVYIGSNDYKVYAINSDGSLKWSYTTGNVVPGSPAIGSDGTLYIGSTDYKIYAFKDASAVAPVAVFSGTPTSGTNPLTVVFTDASTNTPTSWAWDFGDNSTTNATMQNPVHTFAAAGNYTVALTATNSAGSNTATQTGYITVSSAGIVTLPDMSAAPTDPDGDGLYEDLSGNGALSYKDLQEYFINMDWIAENEPVASFDFSGNGKIGYTDLQNLFARL
jgi:PKD repeat protein